MMLMVGGGSGDVVVVVGGVLVSVHYSIGRGKPQGLPFGRETWKRYTKYLGTPTAQARVVAMYLGSSPRYLINSCSSWVRST